MSTPGRLRNTIHSLLPSRVNGCYNLTDAEGALRDYAQSRGKNSEIHSAQFLACWVVLIALVDTGTATYATSQAKPDPRSEIGVGCIRNSSRVNGVQARYYEAGQGELP